MNPGRYFLLSFLCSLPLLLMGQANRALLVGIDRYPVDSGWAEIHGVNDVALVWKLLTAKGFPETAITTLLDEEATKAAIVKGLEQLTKDTNAGDFVYIQFSCHGQQMVDDNGDEPDWLDEAIIPYDASRRFTAGRYEGENHLRDDEIKLHLDTIRRKAGIDGNVLIVFDACHSGTADRNKDEDVYVRGTTYVFAPPGYKRPKWGREEVQYTIGTEPGMSALTVVAACRPDGLNYEYRLPDGRYLGTLTFALYKLTRDRSTFTFKEFRSLLTEELAALTLKRSKLQIPLLETSDETKEFSIGYAH